MTKNLKILLIILGVVVIGCLGVLAFQSPELVEDVVEIKDFEMDDVVVSEDVEKDIVGEELELEEQVVDEEAEKMVVIDSEKQKE